MGSCQQSQASTEAHYRYYMSASLVKSSPQARWLVAVVCRKSEATAPVCQARDCPLQPHPSTRSNG